MKIIVRILALSILSVFSQFSPGIVCGQNRIMNASGNNTSGNGRDFWFAIPLNYTGSSQKNFTVYVNSNRNTTVNFQIANGPLVKKNVTAGQVTSFASYTPQHPAFEIPISTELLTSGIVEQKAIHIWSDDADIAVNLLSRRDYSSEGMSVIPAVRWGTEYIVGAYESLFDPSGSADWPSEFTVVANQDNTTITITPTWDLRKDSLPKVIEHPKLVPFTFTLNKGECIQFQTVLPVKNTECDVTGTLISSTIPVGVIAGSAGSYIPFPHGYSDFIVEMLQPVGAWGATYFTAPFAGRKFGGDVYLVLGTKGQTIFRNGLVAAQLASKADHSFIYDSTGASPAAIWTSDAPFGLFQYIPSATFGAQPNGSNRNPGDPAMVVINSLDLYKEQFYIVIPAIDASSGQLEFTNFVNIILPTSHEHQTKYDGVPLDSTSFPPNVLKRERLPIPGTLWEAIRLTYLLGKGGGSHSITSDTGVNAYMYGYGTDDSYAWNGSLGFDTLASWVHSEGYQSSLSKGSSEYHILRSLLDAGDEIAMLPPVPNPVSAAGGNIRFFYGLKYNTPIDLSIFDVLGNLVASVVHSENGNAGIFESELRIGGSMPSGSYIYRLAGAGRVVSGRFVVAR